MKVTQGADMPSEEFEALLAKQPPLESRWQPTGFGRDWPTPEWHELTDGQRAVIASGWKDRAEAAEAKLAQVVDYIEHHEKYALNRGRAWAPGLRAVLELKA